MLSPPEFVLAERLGIQLVCGHVTVNLSMRESAAGLPEKQLLPPLPWACDTTIFLSLHVVCLRMAAPALPAPPDTPQPFPIQVSLKEVKMNPQRCSSELPRQAALHGAPCFFLGHDLGL